MWWLTSESLFLLQRLSVKKKKKWELKMTFLSIPQINFDWGLREKHCRLLENEEKVFK